MRPIFQSCSLWQLFWLSSNSFNLWGMTWTSACTNNWDLSLNLFSVMLVVTADTAAPLQSHPCCLLPSPTRLVLPSFVTWRGGEKDPTLSRFVEISPLQKTTLHHGFSDPLGTWKLFNHLMWSLQALFEHSALQLIGMGSSPDLAGTVAGPGQRVL